LDIIAVLTTMVAATAWMGLAIFLTLACGLLFIFLLFRFGRAFMRPGCSGYLGIMGGIVLSLVLMFPGVFLAILPKPLDTIVIIALVLLFVWAIIQWLIERGKPKTVFSAYSRTESIRMEPYCLFCRKPNRNVVQHTVEYNSEENGVKSYSSATYPIPAHYDCYEKSLKKDGLNDTLIIVGISLGFVAFITNWVIIASSGLDSTKTPFLQPFLWAGVLLPLVLGLMSWILYKIGVDTIDMIVHYYKKHKQ
jgi:hypothetical protein